MSIGNALMRYFRRRAKEARERRQRAWAKALEEAARKVKICFVK